MLNSKSVLHFKGHRKSWAPSSHVDGKPPADPRGRLGHLGHCEMQNSNRKNLEIAKLKIANANFPKVDRFVEKNQQDEKVGRKESLLGPAVFCSAKLASYLLHRQCNKHLLYVS